MCAGSGVTVNGLGFGLVLGLMPSPVPHVAPLCICCSGRSVRLIAQVVAQHGGVAIGRKIIYLHRICGTLSLLDPMNPLLNVNPIVYPALLREIVTLRSVVPKAISFGTIPCL